MSGRPDHAAARWADEAAEVEADEVRRAVEGTAGSADASSPEAGEVVDVAAARGALDEGEILADVAAISAQRDEYLESLQRLKADFDNYRKRVTRLQEEQTARAEANLVGKLLLVIDNLDLAWAHLGPRAEDARGTDETVSEEARAIAQARDQLLAVLSKEGLERVDAVGVPFDPSVHDAVARADVSEESEGVQGARAPGAVGAARAGAAVAAGNGGDGTPHGPAPHTVSVDGVLRAGYRWRGQVLRPAMVRVRG